MSFGSDRTKAWRDIWGVGQGMGSIDEILPVAMWWRGSSMNTAPRLLRWAH
jgi:hypothetical protein